MGIESASGWGRDVGAAGAVSPLDVWWPQATGAEAGCCWVQGASIHCIRGAAACIYVFFIYKTSIDVGSPCQFVPRIVPIYPVDLRRSCRYVPCIVPKCPVHGSSLYRFLPWRSMRRSHLSRGFGSIVPICPVHRSSPYRFLPWRSMRRSHLPRGRGTSLPDLLAGKTRIVPVSPVAPHSARCDFLACGRGRGRGRATTLHQVASLEVSGCMAWPMPRFESSDFLD